MTISKPSVGEYIFLMLMGVSVVPWLIRNITGIEYEYSNPLERKGLHLFTVGSILQSATRDCIIWGSGFISKNSSYKSEPQKIACVRGPLTAKRLQYLGAPAPDVYCDPALIVPHFIDRGNVIKKNKVGLIMHYADKKWLQKIEISRDPNIILINVETADIQCFVNEILECDCVVSSSLHGVIISESVGVPAFWGKCADDVFGDDFKFHDYFLSTGRQVKPLNLFSITAKDILSPGPVPHDVLNDMAMSALSVFPSEYLGGT